MLTRRTLLALMPFASVASAAATARYSGVYVLNWEEQTFTVEGGGEPWWTVLIGEAEAAMNAARPKGAKTPYGFRIRAEVEGVLSPPGAYGHMGAYKRHLTITRVISAKLAEP